MSIHSLPVQTSSGAPSGTRALSMTVNGKCVDLMIDPSRSLLDVLRAELALKGPRYGCGMGQCGACTVLVDGAPARACMLRATRLEGCRITTLEGLADTGTGTLHPVQQGFLEKQGAQCGYCLNGMVMSALALLNREPSPDAAGIRDALRHNLCRCGTHREIIASVQRAAQLMHGDHND